VNIPSNPYAASKAAQDALCIAYWRTYNLPIIITNCMNLFGERQHPEKYISMLISKVTKGETVTVHGSPEYIGKRMYLHALNLPHAWHFILTKTTPTRYRDAAVLQVPDRYNIVGVQEVDNLELAQAVAKILGKPLRYELMDFHSARPGHDRRYALDGAKIAALGWKPTIGFQEGLERTAKWCLANPVWM
jgi:dTDP-glucose 4,6-dehydratase